jgi:hypothetical protein
VKAFEPKRPVDAQAVKPYRDLTPALQQFVHQVTGWEFETMDDNIVSFDGTRTPQVRSHVVRCVGSCS